MGEFFGNGCKKKIFSFTIEKYRKKHYWFSLKVKTINKTRKQFQNELHGLRRENEYRHLRNDLSRDFEEKVSDIKE